ncbi:hypothetical protein QQS21_010594 [Conoideocrella luteorostrata]|uniref:5'-nucleotidase n=1 Tax=Conoideocrella luteorostrata TaxID=1105319 RepID=A0AAJ0CHG0_9HYPO|nr:hypothetical protein QQS21_010594 [Conoideocrella luteorostrata]
MAAIVAALSDMASVSDLLFSDRLAKRGVDSKGNYKMSFFHVNDVHAHLDQFTKHGTDVIYPAQDGYGGYARIKTKVNELRRQNPDSLFLNAGDEFQGTLFFSLFGSEKIAETLNDLRFDAMTLGNHEWDLGDEALGKFLKKLNFPVVSCNVRSSYPDIKETLKPYEIFPAYEVAVIGVTTETTATTSRVGRGTKFLDPVPQVQKTVDEIRQRHPIIKRIVVLSHLGFDIDKKLAAETEGLSLIIGGHTNTLLGNMENAEGTYPTIEKNLRGHEVFIVTAYRWGEYLGRIDVTFDPEGRPLAYHGSPEHMDKTVEQEKTLQDRITSWRYAFSQYMAQVGETTTLLDGEDCWQRDCLLGQVLTDAMLNYRPDNIAEAQARRPDFALINSGIIRASMAPGIITKGDLKTCFPFDTTIVQVTYTGAELRSIIEGCLCKVNQFNQKPVTSWFQVSDGVTIKYDASKPAGSRVAEIRIQGRLLEEERDYRMVTAEYLLDGGDNMMPRGRDVQVMASVDKALVSYLDKVRPLKVDLKERVVLVEQVAQPPVQADEENQREKDKAEKDKAQKAQAAKQKAVQSVEKLKNDSGSRSWIGNVLGGIAVGIGALGGAAFGASFATTAGSAASQGIAAAGASVTLRAAAKSVSITLPEIVQVVSEFNPDMAMEIMLDAAPRPPVSLGPSVSRKILEAPASIHPRTSLSDKDWVSRAVSPTFERAFREACRISIQSARHAMIIY